MINWNVTARQKTSLLVRISIHGVLDEILADPAIVQQCGAFSRRTISCDLLLLMGSREQKIQEVELGLLDLPPIMLIALHRGETGMFFFCHQAFHTQPNPVCRILRPASINAQRTAVRL